MQATTPNLSKGAGKGDQERSTGWRQHFHTIAWDATKAEGFEQVGPKRMRKKYGSK
jgi:hypothetical protein